MTMDNLPASSMTREEARRLTDEIKADVEDFLEKVTPKLIRMYIEGGWYALGYETWDEYCEADLGSIRLPKALRTQTVLTLRHAGLTIRPIAKALGLSHGTVGAIVKDADGPQWVKGPDGKYYPASSPTKTDESESEKPETPTDLAEIEAGVQNWTPDLENGPSTVAETPTEVDESAVSEEPVEPEVVAPPRTPKRRSIVDTAVDLGHDLRKVSDRVVKITADDRLDKNRDGVGGQLRHCLGQMIESCRELGHRIDPPTEPTPVAAANAPTQADTGPGKIAARRRNRRVDRADPGGAMAISRHQLVHPGPWRPPDCPAVRWRGRVDRGHDLRLAAGHRRRPCPARHRVPWQRLPAHQTHPGPAWRLNEDSEFWTVPWSGLGDDIDRLVGKARRLERERVRYDVYGKVAKALNNRIDKLFDSYGDWASDDMQVKLPNITGIVAHRPTAFDDLVTKIDRNAPPDFRDWPLPSGA